MSQEESLVLNLPEVAEILKISRATAYNLATQGIIPTLRLGKRLVVPRAALMKMLEGAGAECEKCAAR